MRSRGLIAEGGRFALGGSREPVRLFESELPGRGMHGDLEGTGLRVHGTYCNASSCRVARESGR